MSKITTGWYKLYRPKTINEYVFQNEIVESNFKKYIEQKDFPDLLLSGHRGTGKTTLLYILQNEIGIDSNDILVLNASDDNSVDDVRHVIKPFINTLSIGKFRLVFLDEADALTIQAQEALKSMMEDESRNARFILTCNKPYKIIPELRSRCTEYTFTSMDKTSMKKIVLEILVKQGMDLNTVDKAELLDILDKHLDLAYPDLRKYITSIEQAYVDGVLHPPSIEDLEVFIKLFAYVDNGDWEEVRTLIYSDMSSDDMINVYKFFAANLDELKKCKNDDVMRKVVITLAHYASLHDTSAIPELNLLACMAKIIEIS